MAFSLVRQLLSIRELHLDNKPWRMLLRSAHARILEELRRRL